MTLVADWPWDLQKCVGETVKDEARVLVVAQVKKALTTPYKSHEY
jgi:hypothetical protein